MVFSRRIRCHYCGARTAQSKAAGVQQFKCSTCEAWNYLDENGEITDPPVDATEGHSTSRESFETFTRPLPPSLDHQRNPTFCSTCQQNQRIYMETLSNYLPDDDHPQYQEYERALPKFQADLEKRYPQICKKCAPQAQMRINRADYHAGAQNVAHQSRSRNLRNRTGTRESWDKRMIRLVLDLCGLVARLSVVAQVAWHVYALCNLTVSGVTEDITIDVAKTPRQCLEATVRGHFDSGCERSIAESLPNLFLIATCLLWYNPGIRSFYHPTYRIEEVKGQAQYFYLQVILLLVRSYSWLKLSNPAYARGQTKQRLLAFHGMVITLISITELLGSRLVKPIIYQHHFQITPQPHERDIFANVAGPDTPQQDAVASASHPNKLFAKDDPRPFPIWNLAPNSAKPATQYPSPPQSRSNFDAGEVDSDAMDIDWQPSAHYDMPGAPMNRTFQNKPSEQASSPQAFRSLHNHGSTQPLGWGAMREETFRIQKQTTTEAQRRQKEAEDRARLTYQPPSEQSPFRGRLPPAPMSLERRLRNPVTQVQFKKVPLSKQQDFLKQMRDGIDMGKNFSTDSASHHRHANQRLADENDEDDGEFRPPSSSAKSRTKGSLDLKQSTWTLPSDMATATGLEDLFGGNSFSIADQPAIPEEPAAAEAHNAMVARKHVMRVTIPVVLLLVVWNITPLRRALCLWLVSLIDRIGL